MQAIGSNYQIKAAPASPARYRLAARCASRGKSMIIPRFVRPTSSSAKLRLNWQKGFTPEIARSSAAWTALGREDPFRRWRAGNPGQSQVAWTMYHERRVRMPSIVMLTPFGWDEYISGCCGRNWENASSRSRRPFQKGGSLLCCSIVERTPVLEWSPCHHVTCAPCPLWSK